MTLSGTQFPFESLFYHSEHLSVGGTLIGVGGVYSVHHGHDAESSFAASLALALSPIANATYAFWLTLTCKFFFGISLIAFTEFNQLHFKIICPHFIAFIQRFAFHSRSFPTHLN